MTDEQEIFNVERRFWGGSLHGQTRKVAADSVVMKAVETDYSMSTLEGFSAALDYAGGYKQVEFPRKNYEYHLTEGEFIEISLLRGCGHSFKDVLIHLAKRPLKCPRCKEKQ